MHHRFFKLNIAKFDSEYGCQCALCVCKSSWKFEFFVLNSKQKIHIVHGGVYFCEFLDEFLWHHIYMSNKIEFKP